MKFKTRIGGLVTALKPAMIVADKGANKDYPQAFLLTLIAKAQSIETISDGGHMSITNEFNNQLYDKLDYSVVAPGTATVKAADFQQLLSSFSPDDVVTIELREVKGADGSILGKEMVVALDSDAEQFQTIPVSDSECKFQEPTSAKKATKITMRRDVFTSYASKIMFAHGFIDQYKEFLYWILRAYDNGSLRFAAGTGKRFAVVELEGANVSDSKKELSIYFPNDQTQTIISVLKELKAQDIQIESQERYVSISCDQVKISLYSCNPSIQWPNEDRFLKRQSKYSITTKVSNWRNAVKGILATNSDESKEKNKVHSCSLSIDLAKKIIQTKTDSVMKSSRKITIADIATNESDNQINLSCPSAYINEIVNKVSDDDFIQIEIEDAVQPVIVRYYAAADGVKDYLTLKKPNDDGLQERYSIFFATLRND